MKSVKRMIKQEPWQESIDAITTGGVTNGLSEEVAKCLVTTYMGRIRQNSLESLETLLDVK